MKHKIVCIALVVFELFVAVTAIISGVAILAGGLQMPLELLRNTPFSDYTIPALVLAIVVGGSSLVAAALVLAGREIGVLVSLTAGLIMVGWIAVQVVMIGLIIWLQPFYFVLGLAIFGLAARLWMTEVWHHHVQSGSV